MSFSHFPIPTLKFNFHASSADTYLSPSLLEPQQDQGNRTTPSYVAFTDSERLIGDSAKFVSTSLLPDSNQCTAEDSEADDGIGIDCLVNYTGTKPL